MDADCDKTTEKIYPHINGKLICYLDSENKFHVINIDGSATVDPPVKELFLGAYEKQNLLYEISIIENANISQKQNKVYVRNEEKSKVEKHKILIKQQRKAFPMGWQLCVRMKNGASRTRRERL